jgi:glycosyltransferase involved in cell wall biosynthesis
MMTDLAVIMSVYRNDKLEFLRQSVNSILTQTYSDFDFFIAIDGPVLYEVDNYLDNLKDKRIKLSRIENNGGLAKALNYLLEIVLKNPDYKLIARMDADDISSPVRFEKQHSFFSENSVVTCLGSWYEEIDVNGKHISFRSLPNSHEELKKRFSIRTPFAHSSVMLRREMIENVGFYPTDIFKLEDYVYWSLAISKGMTFANIPEILLQFRIDENFYKRRSGIKFGFYYIKARIRINKILKLPFYIYLYSFSVGIIRMMPSFAIQWFYNKIRSDEKKEKD